jgi:SdrD B-like domain
MSTTLPGSAVGGTLYLDNNRNGQLDAGESRVAGQQIFIDLNFNQTADAGEPSMLTNADGTYRFDDVQAGPLAVIARSGFRQSFSNPAGGIRWFTLFACGTDRLNENFGLRTIGPKITGTIFRDDNANGTQDNAEPVVQGQAVYLDLNNDGIKQEAEPGTASGLNGRYLFEDVALGTAVVRLDSSDCYDQVSPGGNAPRVVNVVGETDVDNVNFGVQGDELGTQNIVRGTMYNDNNRNGSNDFGDTPAPGLQVFVDYNFNNVADADEPSMLTMADGTYEFVDVRSGPVAIVARSGFRQAFSNPTSGVRYFTLFDCGSTREGQDFGLRTIGVNVTGSIFEDLNSNGSKDASEMGVAGVGVYYDLNLNGSYDENEPTTASNFEGNYLFSDVPIGSGGVGVFASDCVLPLNGGYRSFPVTGLSNITGIDLGVRIV